MLDFKRNSKKARRPVRRRRAHLPARRGGRRPSQSLASNTLESKPIRRRTREMGTLVFSWIKMARRLFTPRAAFALVGVWLIYGVIHGVMGAWRAPLTDLDISGLGQLTPAGVAAAAQLYPGMAVGDIDPFVSAQRILGMSHVREVTVRRTLPGRLSIWVQERRAAVVVLLAGGETALIDSDGVVLETHVPQNVLSSLALPRIRSAATVAPLGHTIDDAVLARGMDLLRHAVELGLGGGERLLVDASRPYMSLLILPERGRTVLLPQRQAARALGTYVGLEPVLDNLHNGMQGALTVDMRAVFRNGAGWVALRR